MGQNQKWLSTQSTLTSLKQLVAENVEPQKEALGRESFIGLQKLGDALTLLDIAIDHFASERRDELVDRLRPHHTELKAIKYELEKEMDQGEGSAPLSGDVRMEEHNPFAVCNAMAKKHGWSKDKTEKCILKLKKKPGATYEELERE